MYSNDKIERETKENKQLGHRGHIALESNTISQEWHLAG